VKQSSAGADWQLHSGDRHALGGRHAVRLGHGGLQLRSWVLRRGRCRRLTLHRPRRWFAPLRRLHRDADRAAIAAYLAAVDIRGRDSAPQTRRLPALRRNARQNTWRDWLVLRDDVGSAMEILGRGQSVPYGNACVLASTGPDARAIRSGRETLARAEALGCAGFSRAPAMSCSRRWMHGANRAAFMASIQTLRAARDRLLPTG